MKKQITTQVYSTKELIEKMGHRMAIHKASEEGELVSLGAGFYSTPNIDPFTAQVHVVAKYYPKAVISGISALFIYELTDEMSNEVHVDIIKTTSIRNVLLHTKRVAESRLIGIDKLSYKGRAIRIYNVERALCDAYRIDRSQIFYSAIKLYAKNYDINTKRIAKYDKILGTKVLEHLQQELTNE